jgi:hypothetical protein
MKKILFVIGVVSLLIACQKEVSEIQSSYFVRFYGDSLDDFGSEADQTADGGYVFAGTTTSRRSSGDTDIMLITTDKFGIQNMKTTYYGGEGNETCKGLLVLDDGFVITGSYTSNGGVDSVLLVKFGTDGTLQWTSSWTSPGQGIDIEIFNGEIFIAGYLLSPDGFKRPMICSFDMQGNKVDLFAPTSNSGDFFTALGTRNNQIFGLGTSFKNVSNSDMYIKGSSTDIVSFSLAGNETSAHIINGKDGGYFIIGTTDPIGAGFSQIVVKKLNSNFGEDLTFNTNPLGFDADYSGVDMQEMEDGTIAVLGNKAFSKDTDIVLFFLNSDGTTRSTKTYGKTGTQSASSLKITSDGGLIILGSNQQEKTNSMITLIKTDKDGNIWE